MTPSPKQSIKNDNHHAAYNYGTLFLNEMAKYHFYNKLNKTSFNMLDSYDHTKITTASQRAIDALLL